VRQAITVYFINKVEISLGWWVALMLRGTHSFINQRKEIAMSTLLIVLLVVLLLSGGGWGYSRYRRQF
jgi:hypothetical protein